MPLPKKILYYGIMLLLTLLAVEGMARLAYYLAFDQGYGGAATPEMGDVRAAPAAATTPAAEPAAAFNRARVRHPFYAYTHPDPWAGLNEMPPRPESADTVVIALVGGSVAEQVRPYLQRAVYRYFIDHNLPRRPTVLALADGAMKQPSQLAVAANTLLLGGHFDLLVNLDGFNEIYFSFANRQKGVFPFYPEAWSSGVDLTATETLLIGRIALLRAEQAELQRRGAVSPFRYTALYGLASRYRQGQLERQIIQGNHELAAAASTYSLEKHGPRRTFAKDPDFLQAAARVWYRGSLLLASVAQLAGADYYHFLQPNQYVPDAKPLSAAELANFYRAGTPGEQAIRKNYHPRMQELGARLQRESPAIHYFDLTGIFAAHPETLYADACCHLNERGNELLAAALVERLVPALRRAAIADKPASGLTDAARPMLPDELLINADFQVYRRDGNRLLYVKDNCVAADLENPFFLHILPADLADLPAERRPAGFANQDFDPILWGGGIINGQCRVEKPLLDYPIAAIRTGQFNAAGEIWGGEYHFPR